MTSENQIEGGPGTNDKLSEIVEVGEYQEREYRVFKVALDSLPYNHYCGCVKVANPDNIRWRSRVDMDGDYVPADVSVHGGITSGPSSDGWVEFDCNHARDCCFDDDGAPLLGSVNMREYERDREEKTCDWYPDDVAEECRSIIDQAIETNGKLCDCSQEMLYDEQAEEFYCPYCDV